MIYFNFLIVFENSSDLIDKTIYVFAIKFKNIFCFNTYKNLILHA
jgi:hypothetical protein